MTQPTPLAIPTVSGNVPAVAFDPKPYRADLVRMSDTDLDDEIERSLVVGVRGLEAFAMAVKANATGRHVRGKRHVKEKGGRGKKLLAGANGLPLTPAVRTQRSEELKVAELTDDEVDDALAAGEGWGYLRRLARSKNPKPTPALPRGKFDLILADPPWRYEFAESDTREIENQYPTMTVDEIKDLAVPAADDATLYLWTTTAKLVEGLDVMDAWGFTYKSSMVWVKDKIGMGYHARGRHEFILIGTKGTPGVPEPEDRPDSVIEAPRTEHSRKPDRLYELIETAYPDRRYLELFARRPRDDWEAWGNEA